MHVPTCRCRAELRDSSLPTSPLSTMATRPSFSAHTRQRNIFPRAPFGKVQNTTVESFQNCQVGGISPRRIRFLAVFRRWEHAGVCAGRVPHASTNTPAQGPSPHALLCGHRTPAGRVEITTGDSFQLAGCSVHRKGGNEVPVDTRRFQ